MMKAEVRLRGNPERIFVSVDESNGRATLSFAPAVGDPIAYEDDRQGAKALADAQAIAVRHPGCAVSGPHFHGAPLRPRRPQRGPR